jgi:hypothetical protein
LCIFFLAAAVVCTEIEHDACIGPNVFPRSVIISTYSSEQYAEKMLRLIKEISGTGVYSSRGKCSLKLGLPVDDGAGKVT